MPEVLKIGWEVGSLGIVKHDFVSYDSDLIEQVKELLRRPIAKVFKFDNFLLSGELLMQEATEICLRPMELKLLKFLLSHPYEYWTAEQLIVRVWGLNSESFNTTVRTHIKNLRLR